MSRRSEQVLSDDGVCIGSEGMRIYINNVGMCLRARLYNCASLIDVLHLSLVQMHVLSFIDVFIGEECAHGGYVPIALWQAHADLLCLELFDSLKQ